MQTFFQWTPESIKFALTNPALFTSTSQNYDCKEFVAYTVLLNKAKVEAEAAFGGGSSEQVNQFGFVWNTKQKTDKQIPGQTFAYWNFAGTIPIGDHAAVYFGHDKSGNEYFITKNGTAAPPTLMPYNELPYLIMLSRTNYK